MATITWLMTVVLAALVIAAFVPDVTREFAKDVVDCAQLPPVDEETSACDHAETVRLLDRDQRAEVSDAREKLLRAALAPLSIIAALLTLRRTRALEASTRTSEHSIDDELYIKAIKHTGDESIATRLGGLFALEQLARRSPDRYAATVYAVLVAYLRSELAEGEGEGEDITSVDEAEVPPGDVEAAVTILTDNSRLFDQHVELLAIDCGEEGPKDNSLHLYGVEFNYKVLTGLSLTDARLTFCDFYDATLIGVTLLEATLTNCSFIGTGFVSCDLNKATLSDGSLFMATLIRCRLRGSVFAACTIRDVHVTEAIGQVASLTGCSHDPKTTWEGVDLAALGSRLVAED